MKVLFTFGGLPHYHNKVLNLLHQQPNTEIVVVAPSNGSATIGKGVEQQEKGIDFRLIRLPEYKTFYGKAFFKGLKQCIATEKPDILVTIWPYILGFYLYPGFAKFIQQQGIKVLYKDIPFMLPKRQDVLQYYTSSYFLRMNENRVQKKAGWIFKQKMKALTWARTKIYTNFVDAHINYIDGAEDILTSYGALPESIFVSYNSTDTHQLAEAVETIKTLPPIQPHNPHRLIHVGRLIKWKRVDLLIEALALLKDEFPQAELTVIGKGPELSNLQHHALAHSVEGAVDFVGGVYAPQDLGRYFKSASLYVLAGMGGLSINEAMAFQTPVVCSVCDGTEKHLVYEGKTGSYFEEGNAHDLALKIAKLWRKPEKIAKMGEAAAEHIRDNINLETVVAGYQKAFNYLAPNK